MKHSIFGVALAAVLLPIPILAQSSFDSSGSSLLNGSYFIRQVLYTNIDNTGDIGESMSLTGTITFDGQGNYTLAGQVSDNTVNSGTPSVLNTTGTYSVNSSGVFIMDNALSAGDVIFGGVGQSAITGSSTENSAGFFDFMVAVPMGSSVNNASFKGTYRMVSMDYPAGDVTQVSNSTFLLQPDGNGSLGDVTVTGHAVNVGDTAYNQTVSGATYSLSSTTGTLNFPSPGASALVAGTKQFYLSADGNILVGGSLNGYDIEIGINVSGTNTFNGIYYLAGEDYDSSSIANNGYYYFDTFYGSANAITSAGSSSVYSDYRLNPDDSSVYDFTFIDQFTLDSDGTAAESFYQYFAGAGGTARLSVGLSTEYGIELDVQALSLPVNNSVSLSPLGVVNTSNYLPVTNPVTPGEFLTLFGTGLAPSVAGSPVPFPTTGLNGVTVTINGFSAPLNYVSSNEIICVVPFELSDPYAVVQVNNNGVVSNSVTLFTDTSAPGFFTLDESGTGAAAALHIDYTKVTASSPADVGETVQAYLTGLGSVSPGLGDGLGAPIGTLFYTDDTFAVYVDGVQANVTFAGLAPGFAGLYQVNFQVPSTPDTGSVYLDIVDQSSGAFNSMALLDVSGIPAAGVPNKPALRTGQSAALRLHRRFRQSQDKPRSAALNPKSTPARARRR